MLTFGFYNSINHDRKYSAVQLTRLFDGILNDGVFASIGTSMVVEAGGEMVVNVGVGRAWFDRTWTDNDAVLPLTISPSEMTFNRIDAVVLEVDTSDASRKNDIKIIKGTPAAVPVNPVLENTETLHQHPLSYVYVGAGVTEILPANLTNTVGTVDCPFITGMLQTITIEGITALLEAEWSEWFSAIKDQLDGNVAGQLLNLIEDVDTDLQGQVDALSANKLDSATLNMLSSYQMFVANINASANCAAFVPCSDTEFLSKKIALGYQIAKYLNEFASDITLTQAEMNLLATKNTWWDICSDAASKTVIARSTSFVTKINAIPFASYVYNMVSEQAFVASVNTTYTKTYTSIQDIKNDSTVMVQLMANKALCEVVRQWTWLEQAFWGIDGEKLRFLTGSGNFVVPDGCAKLYYTMVSSGGSGALGNILHGVRNVVPGQLLAYNVAENASAKTHTTLDGISTSTGAAIADANAGFLTRSNAKILNGVGYGIGGSGSNGAAGNGGGGGAGEASSGINPIGLASASVKTGMGLYGTLTPFVDALMKVAAYRKPTRENESILCKVLNASGIIGGAGGGQGGSQGTNAPFGENGAGGALGGDRTWTGSRYSDGAAGGGCGGCGFGAGGGGGGAGGNGNTSYPGYSGQGSKGIIMLFW